MRLSRINSRTSLAKKWSGQSLTGRTASSGPAGTTNPSLWPSNKCSVFGFSPVVTTGQTHLSESCLRSYSHLMNTLADSDCIHQSFQAACRWLAHVNMLCDITDLGGQ